MTTRKSKPASVAPTQRGWPVIEPATDPRTVPTLSQKSQNHPIEVYAIR